MTPAELQAWMDERGIKASALAQRLGVDRVTVWRWLQGGQSKHGVSIPPYLPRALNDIAAELATRQPEEE